MLKIGAFILCLVLLAVAPALATEFRVGKAASVESGEIIDDDLFIAGNSVLVAGKVTGDVLAAGQTVRVTGPVGGSVMAAGRDVRVTGDVQGSVRMAGQSATLSGTIGRNAALAGQTVVVADTAKIARDLHAAGTTVDLDGAVGRDAGLFAQTVTLRGSAGRHVLFEGEELTVGRSAEVAGGLSYRSPNEPTIEQGATITGGTNKLPPRPGRGIEKAPRRRFPLFFPLTVFVFGVVGLAALPRLFGAAANAMPVRPWWNLLLGFLALVFLPAAAFATMITLVGLPIGVLALVLWGAALMFSGVPVGVFLGRWLLRPIKPGPVSAYLGLFVGLVALTLVGMIPFLGPVSKVLTILFGLGVYARAVKGLVVEMRAHPA